MKRHYKIFVPLAALLLATASCVKEEEEGAGFQLPDGSLWLSAEEMDSPVGAKPSVGGRKIYWVPGEQVWCNGQWATVGTTSVEMSQGTRYAAYISGVPSLGRDQDFYIVTTGGARLYRLDGTNLVYANAARIQEHLKSNLEGGPWYDTTANPLFIQAPSNYVYDTTPVGQQILANLPMVGVSTPTAPYMAMNHLMACVSVTVKNERSQPISLNSITVSNTDGQSYPASFGVNNTEYYDKAVSRLSGPCQVWLRMPSSSTATQLPSAGVKVYGVTANNARSDQDTIGRVTMHFNDTKCVIKPNQSKVIQIPVLPSTGGYIKVSVSCDAIYGYDFTTADYTVKATSSDVRYYKYVPRWRTDFTYTKSTSSTVTIPRKARATANVTVGTSGYDAPLPADHMEFHGHSAGFSVAPTKRVLFSVGHMSIGSEDKWTMSNAFGSECLGRSIWANGDLTGTKVAEAIEAANAMSGGIYFDGDQRKWRVLDTAEWSYLLTPSSIRGDLAYMYLDYRDVYMTFDVYCYGLLVIFPDNIKKINHLNQIEGFEDFTSANVNNGYYSLNAGDYTIADNPNNLTIADTAKLRRLQDAGCAIIQRTQPYTYQAGLPYPLNYNVGESNHYWAESALSGNMSTKYFLDCTNSIFYGNSSTSAAHHGKVRLVMDAN